MTPSSRARLCGIVAALCAVVPPVRAAAPTAAPQVLLAITNSESMDGTTSGAIMVGSGSLGTNFSSLGSSSSPTSYAIPAGFTPPLNAGSGGSAPWTVSCFTSYQCDNGPSRMNMTKAAINQVLTNYGATLNFGVYTYNTSSVSLYTTWVYYMSPSGSGFGFTNTSSSSTVNNPCYQYTSASSSVQTPCAAIAGQYATGVLAGNQYMTVGASSDNALINDVLYAGSGTIPAEQLTYGTVSPSNPYTSYSLGTYNTNINGYSESYSQSSPNLGYTWSTTPTNAGYVPYSPQVLYSQRGFGYGGAQSATTGTPVVAMSTDPASSTFTNALAPETNNAGSGEIKSSAGQSAIYALMNGAKSYLGGLTTVSCQTQYVVLLTDGLPTLDKSGHAWPPLGTTTANAYNLSATYNADGSFAASTSQAVTDAITAITALRNAGIKVFVIGLGAGVNPANNPSAASLLNAMAIAGGTTSAYAATDSTSLNNAFLSIVDIIYRTSAVAAPVAPISVSNGSSFEYELTSITPPASGHVAAYPVAASGVATSSTPTWDAGDANHMPTATRTTALMAANASGSIVALGSVDAAAFNLATTSTCVPNVATIVAYTINPSYSSGNGCSYLAGRLASWPLGVFSTQNTGRYLGPPSSALLTAHYSTYASYARGLSTRTPAVLFTDSDGFLYSVNASTGMLQWGWASRNIVAQWQNYGTFAASGSTNGNFTVVDAMNAGGSWGSYLVGSLQSGAEHFSVALDGTAAPHAMVYDTVISGGTSAGDLAGATGTTPLRQPAVVAYIGTNATAYQVDVVSVGGTSTLYEHDVTAATGGTSAALGFTVTSIIALNSTSNQLWVGGSDGSVRVLRLSGVAATDVLSMSSIGTTVNPASGAAVPVLYLGYVEVQGIPYVFAAGSAQVTVFGVTSAGWTPLWATTPTQGYVFGYNGTAFAWTTSSTVTPMTASSVVSDIPIQLGASLLVPTYVAGGTCSAGSGYYDFFNLATGAFPTLQVTNNGTILTADMAVGPGPAFTPSLTSIANGIALSPGSGGDTTPQSPLVNKGGLGARAVSWIQH